MSSYDDVAEWYDAVQRGGTIVQDAAMRALSDLSGDVKNRRICDLACGQGIVARAFAERGAQMVGIDISLKLLEIARAEEAARGRGIDYMDMDAQLLSGLAAASFDGVFCNLALMDIPDLGATARAVSRVLRPGGWFLFTIMHPCFQTSDSRWFTEEGKGTGRLVRAYFVEARWNSKDQTGMRARVGAVHRTLSNYFNTFSSAGFLLEAVTEPQIPREPGKLEPAYDEVPALLAARFVKPEE